MEIKKIEWSLSVEPEIKKVLNDFCDFEFIRAEVVSGVSELWQVVDQGLVITRLENDREGKPFELVFVCGVGSDAKEVIEAFVSQVKRVGVKRFRLHSSREGMGRYLSELGFVKKEVVYERVDNE